MIRSLQTEGSCLYLDQINSTDLDQIVNSGFIKNFVLSDQLLGQSMGYPYFQLIRLDQRIQAQSIVKSDHFLGFILKISDLDTYEEVSDAEYLDLEISSFQNAIQFCKKLNPRRQHQIFLSLANETRPSELNHILHWIQKGESSSAIQFFKKPYDLETQEWKDWASLEIYNKKPIYQQSNEKQRPQYSIVIPHFESKYFIVNVLKHLASIDHSELIEVIVVDDGSSSECLQYIQYCADKLFPNLNLQILSWEGKPELSTNEKIFRAGASRNWGAFQAQSECLLFLDSDMLVPPNLIQLLEMSLSSADIVQFKRLHIPMKFSNEASNYQELLSSPHLYVEEADYWSKLFESDNWMEIQDYWKMTCTYALAIRKSYFNRVGRFRRQFIRYGFEDTDLGYRVSQNGGRFKIEKTPFLHLTKTNENSQSILFKIRKMNRIKKMAKVFYLLNLDLRIYDLFRSFY